MRKVKIVMFFFLFLNLNQQLRFIFSYSKFNQVCLPSYDFAYHIGIVQVVVVAESGLDISSAEINFDLLTTFKKKKRTP